MSGITLTNLTQAVIEEIGEVSGTSVQTYSEDRIERKVKQAFRFVLKKFWWPEYMKWYSATIDGSTGVINANLIDKTEAEIRFEDIRVILPEKATTPLALLPNTIIPTEITGNNAKYFESLHNSHVNFEDRIIQFWPKAVSTVVNIHAMEVPNPIIGETKLYLDEDLLTHGAAWLILETEALNPDAANTAQVMFDNRFKDIMKRFTDHPIAKRQNIDFITEWSR